MAIELGVGYLTVLPETSKVAPGIRKALGEGERDSETSGRKSGKGYSKGFKSGIQGMQLGALAVAGGIGALVKSSVNLEKQFSQTMNVTAAVLGAPQKEVAKLEKMALRLGASTSFSANEVADAMQELAKGGLTTATIQAGALEGTLQLAAAGGTTLASAAEIASNALNTFNIPGKEMSKVSAALAGGANASTASVESLGQALGQVGPGATQAGLSLNDTVGALAAFDNAGIKGSDAGTSLKTMLTRLVPQTKSARTEMKKLGLDFTDAQGNFVPLTNVAQQLQDKLSDLSDEQRTTALSAIFGSDATRAASVLMEEGAKGLGRYIKATKDQGAAEDASQARMKGTAGALERLSGAWETFRLKIGIAVAPAVQLVSDKLGWLFGFLGRHIDTVLKVGGVIGGLAAAVLVLNGVFLVQRAIATAAAVALGAEAVAAIASTFATKGLFAAISLGIKSIPVIGWILAIVSALIWWGTETETGRRVMAAAWSGIKTAIGATVDWLVGTAWPFIKKVWDGIVVGAQFMWKVLKVIFVTVATVFSLAWQTIVAVWNATGAPVLRAIIAAATAVWEWLGKNIFPQLQLAFRLMVLSFQIIKARVWDPVWSGIKSTADKVWQWLSQKVFAPLGRAVHAMGEAFKPVAKVISAAWDKIKAAAAKPINFVIETVYTRGIKATWDRIADAVGLDLKLPTINKIGGYATGGVLPGYTPGRDVHEFYSPTGGRLSLSGGEAIMRPEFTRAVGGPAGVAALNAKARRGQAFADGGVFGWAGDIWENAKATASNVAKVLGNPGAALADMLSKPVKAVLGSIGGGTVGKIAGQLPTKIVGSLISKAKDLVSGLMPGGGAPSGPVMGWQNMWNVVKSAFPGASLNSAFRPGAVTAVGTQSMHALGRAIDVTPSMEIFNWLAKHFPNSNELIYSPANGRQLYKGRQTMFGEPTRGDHFDHVHWSMFNGGVLPKLYDDGGWLPNKGLGLNMTGKPEAVLTPAESQALKAGVLSASAEARRYANPANGTSRTAPERRRVTVSIGAREFEGYMTEIAEDAIDADNGFAGTTRRMG